MNIGKFILELRKEKGLTQKELGEKLFVTDKAVSKWERGLSLPDITILPKLAKILDVEVADILVGQKGSNKDINIKEELEKLNNEIKKQSNRKIKKLIVILILLLIIIIYIIFRNTSLGYDIKKVNYVNTNINLGIPKMSFMIKNNDRSYSFKNLRNSTILENEIKKYLKTLKYSSCNNTIYYYNEKDNFSIIEYSIKNNIFYSTISYQVTEGDYCYENKITEYSKKLGSLKSIHSLNGWKTNLDNVKDSELEVVLLDGYSTDYKLKYEFNLSLQVFYYKRKSNNEIDTYTLENSNGTYEIRDDKLYYYRTNILEKSDDIQIPEVSVFKIENEKLILIDNYLSNYEKNIILK